MSNRPRPSQSPERRPTRRQLAAQQREANVQRRAILAISGAVGLALLLIISGIVYDRLIQPRATIKQVNNATLTRAEYENLVRANTIQQIIQGLQFSKLFGSNQSLSQSGQFDEQVVQANVRLSEIGTSRDRQQEPDGPTVQQWVDQQILEQGAKSQFNIDPQPGEIDQQVVSQYGSLLESAEPVTSTATTTDTATTATAGATSAAATSAAATATSSLPTATALPTATPEAAEATNQTNQIVDVLYTEYTNILEALPEGALERQRRPNITKEEMLRVLRDSMRQEVIRAKLGEALLKEAPPEEENPSAILVRHILLQVPKPTPTPTPTPTDDPNATAEPEATATPVPTPVPTPSAEELEQQFTERKREADALYQQLVANPDSFDTVAREKSDDTTSATNGGRLDAFDREGNVVGQQGQTLVKPFVDAAWQLKLNEISQPVRTDFGWHIIQRIPEDPKLKLERLRNEAIEKWIAEQNQKATIVPPPTPTPTIEPTPTTEQPAEATTQPEATTEATTTP